jgi:hypothetical protein
MLLISVGSVSAALVIARAPTTMLPTSSPRRTRSLVGVAAYTAPTTEATSTSMATPKGTARIGPVERTSRSGTRTRVRYAVKVTFVRKFSAIAVLASVLLLTGCSYDTTVTSNVGLTFPDQALPYLFVVVYSPLLLAVLAVGTSLVAIITLRTTARAASRRRPVRRWPVVMSVVLSALLIIAAVAVVVLRLALSWVAFG